MAIITNQTTNQKEIKMQECLRKNDDRLLSKLYDNEWAVIFRLILKWVRNAEAAENLLQDVFVKAWRSRDLYNSEKGKVFTWMYNISRNVCIDHLRSKAYKKSRVSILSDDVTAMQRPGRNEMMMPDTIGLRKLV